MRWSQLRDPGLGGVALLLQLRDTSRQVAVERLLRVSVAPCLGEVAGHHAHHAVFESVGALVGGVALLPEYLVLGFFEYQVSNCAQHRINAGILGEPQQCDDRADVGGRGVEG
ncbi:hypothetical protein G6F24_012730 [Rhizopus arrhizus]|nr:hypothetical protein G6F24_012730 [Rhizopus arrhizus]